MEGIFPMMLFSFFFSPPQMLGAMQSFPHRKKNEKNQEAHKQSRKQTQTKTSLINLRVNEPYVL